MVRTAFAALEIYGNQRFQNEAVSSFDIANYSDSVLNMIISDVVTPIPPFNTTTQMPGQFLSGDGAIAKLDVRFEFATPAKSGNAIIYYRAQNC